MPKIQCGWFQTQIRTQAWTKWEQITEEKDKEMDLVPETPDMVPEVRSLPLWVCKPSACQLAARSQHIKMEKMMDLVVAVAKEDLNTTGQKSVGTQHGDKCTGSAIGKLKKEELGRLAMNISLQRSMLHLTGPLCCQIMVAPTMSRWTCM